MFFGFKKIATNNIVKKRNRIETTNKKETKDPTLKKKTEKKHKVLYFIELHSYLKSVSMLIFVGAYVCDKRHQSTRSTLHINYERCESYACKCDFVWESVDKNKNHSFKHKYFNDYHFISVFFL